MTGRDDSAQPNISEISASGKVPEGVTPAGRVPAQRVYGSARVPPPPVKNKRLAVLLPVLILVVLIAGGATLQLNRALPAAAVTTSIASTVRIPGTADLPWPSTGSAELMIDGLGRIGGSGGDGAEPIGSVAKVMTAYLILKNHPLADGEEGPALTVTDADVRDYQGRIPSGQSLVPVQLGEVLTERDALEALLLPSANNIAHMLAVWDAGSEDAFVAAMNAAAAELGMTDSKYTDPSGFLPSTVSTAADQVILARAALDLPSFAGLVSQRSATIPVAGTIENYNDLLGELGVFGIKTGSTTEAGGNLVFASRLSAGGRTLTVVGAVFNQPGTHTPEQIAQVNRVVRKLLNAVRGIVKEYTLVPDQPVGEITTAWGSRATVSPVKPVKVVGWPGLTVPVKVTTAAPGAEITAGQVVGEVAAADVRVGLSADSAMSSPSVWWRLFRKP